MPSKYRQTSFKYGTSLIPKERFSVFRLEPNELYKIYLEKSIGKDKMRFYWNCNLNPLSPPKEFNDLHKLTEEESGGEVFYLKNGSNVIFLDMWLPFALFYSLDKQKVLFRHNLKSVYFNKL